ncbi:MAG TPA: thermonuclease family protein [Nocardioides sp.]
MRARLVGIALVALTAAAVWAAGAQDAAWDDGPEEPGGTPSLLIEPPPGTAVVTAVVDGDTIRVQQDGEEHRVRLLGIDAPEVRDTPECGGPEASDALRDLLPVGTEVVLRDDPTQDPVDRYGRLLRYVEAPDGADIGVRLLLTGWVATYVFAEPFDRLDLYSDAEDEARDDERGAWGAC